MKTLNIIGCGKLAQSLAKIWSDNNLLKIDSILNRSPETTRAALQHIGAGNMSSKLEQMPAADLWLIAAPDQQIPSLACALAQFPIIDASTIVFHCSGALGSEVLSPLRKKGAEIASLHPAMTFPEPLVSTTQFVGTRCCCEGSAAALVTLKPLFIAIGGHCFDIEPSQKPLYHAATVTCCNLLTALTEASSQLFTAAGIPASISSQIMQPLMQSTLDNIFNQGTTNALTGPIARGDHDTIKKHHAALENLDPKFLHIYQSLSTVAKELADRKNAH